LNAARAFPSRRLSPVPASFDFAQRMPGMNEVSFAAWAFARSVV
jgi:hypothetical protein